MSENSHFEQLAKDAYEQFDSFASAYYYRFSRKTVSSNSKPCMLFLGNHSAGKSSIINWLVGGDVAVQDVGLAPTDDGFTVLVYGETEEDICGPAAVARLPEEFSELKNFGSNFLQHLRIKVRDRALLKKVTLIDSPGMIDSAEHTVNRAYDFKGVVRVLGELCDMVFFILDPDKPGTTGETVNVFSECLVGMEFKLRVLLNKCDAFSSLYDFARTYGTTCWNLARVLHTKDLPKILTIYSGQTRQKGTNDFDFSDFNRHRDEFINVVNDAVARRRDNIYSQVVNDFRGLSIRACVINHIARRIFGMRILTAVIGALVSAGLGFFVWCLPNHNTYLNTVLSFMAGTLVAAIGLCAFYYIAKLVVFAQRLTVARYIDNVFNTEYRQQIALGNKDYIPQIWNNIREETIKVVRCAPLDKLPFFAELRRKKLDATADNLIKEFSKITNN